MANENSHVIRCYVCGTKVGVSNEPEDPEDFDLCDRCEGNAT